MRGCWFRSDALARVRGIIPVGLNEIYNVLDQTPRNRKPRITIYMLRRNILFAHMIHALKRYITDSIWLPYPAIRHPLLTLADPDPLERSILGQDRLDTSCAGSYLNQETKYGCTLGLNKTANSAGISLTKSFRSSASTMPATNPI